MAKQLSAAEKKRLQRLYNNEDVSNAMREGRDSQVVSMGPYDYQVVNAGDGFSQLVRTHRAKQSKKNMGIMAAVVERETRVVKKKE
jgi:hypothetical protein